MDYARLFQEGLPYTDFLARYGNESQRAKWAMNLERARLSEEQLQSLARFQREMPVMILAGTWCGDCADQCPIFERFAQAAGVIRVRYFDRDAATEFAPLVKICGGARVPSVLFLSEDFQEVGRYGDRTLAKYREIVAKNSGESCSTGLGGNSSLQLQVVQEWLEQFERAQLILRTSPRLRQKHGD